MFRNSSWLGEKVCESSSNYLLQHSSLTAQRMEGFEIAQPVYTACDSPGWSKFNSQSSILWWHSCGQGTPARVQLAAAAFIASCNESKLHWAVALTGAASRKPLIEGSTAVTRNMRGCTSLERRPLSNCWTKRQRFCLTKCHPSNPTFRISCSKMERALLSWELSEREGLLTPSVGARRCLCVQQSCLRQVDGLRVLGLSHQFCREWAAKVCLSCWDRT